VIAVSSADFARNLCGIPLLSPAQQTELLTSIQPQYADPRALASHLLERGWLTPYQVNQLLQDKGADLVMGPYVLLQRLGEGGAGQVFKARHQKMNRLVAIKQVRKDLVANPDTVQRFEREMQLLSRLSHPNVVHALDASPMGASYVLVMEYVEGIDLSRLIKENGPLSVEQACDYVRQAAQGLQHILEHGLVHRDIKPSNLLVTRGVVSGLVKILDLGLARVSSADGSTSGSLTNTGSVIMGSVDYMAPEQGLDFRRVDIRGDIYSLGCTLYYLLTGRPPFPDGPVTQKLLLHQLKDPPRLGQFRQDVPAWAAAVLSRMMAKRPEDRYQTPAEAAVALNSTGDHSLLPSGTGIAPVPLDDTAGQMALIEHSITQRGDDTLVVTPVVEHSVKPLALPVGPETVASKRRHWLAAGLGAAVVLVVLAGVVALIFLGRSSNERQVRHEPSSKPAKAVAQSTTAESTKTETFEQWLKKTAALPEQRQQAAVVQKLKERNPKFDGQVQFGVDQYGPVVTLSVDNVQDLAPLRALSQLRRLRCSGSERGKSKLANLGPLQGVQLVELACATTPIADLGPLRGMPLTNLAITSTQVSDLRPLQGMHIHTLNCSHTMVSDLTPLRGMPLTWLQCHNTLVDDLQPLQGMKLVHFTCEGCKVRDLKPLQGMPLESLWCDFEPKRDAEILRSIKTLKEINRQPVQEFWKKQGLTPP
jgi:serine/threonine-protein kinase